MEEMEGRVVEEAAAVVVEGAQVVVGKGEPNAG